MIYQKRDKCLFRLSRRDEGNRSEPGRFAEQRPNLEEHLRRVELTWAPRLALIWVSELKRVRRSVVRLKCDNYGLIALTWILEL